MSNLNELPEIWKEFFDLRKKLNSISSTTFKEVIQNTTTDEEIEKLCCDFKKDFKDYPRNHPLYLEVVKLLLDMGIELYVDDDEEEKKEVDKSFMDCYNNFDPMNMVEVINDNEKEI